MTQQENISLREQQAEDLRRIKDLTELMKQNGLVELRIEHENNKIFSKRYVSQQVAPTIPEPKVESVTLSNTNLTEIKSQSPGTLYMAPSPDSKPYVEVGSHVEPQTVICLIEAMKVMNEIKAEISGTIIQILGKNGQAVEYDQVLFRIRKD